ncbi:MAG: hypothetical protein R3D98_05100 [Candidatus Krumholzibacteriia bacterium]
MRKDLLKLLAEVIRDGSTVTLRSDERKSYPPAIRRVQAIIRHEVTNSRDHQDVNNPLWEINLLDLLIRHAEREPQAGDDRVVEAPAGGGVAAGGAAGVAELRRVPVEEGVPGDAGDADRAAGER